VCDVVSESAAVIKCTKFRKYCTVMCGQRNVVVNDDRFSEDDDDDDGDDGANSAQ